MSCADESVMFLYVLKEDEKKKKTVHIFCNRSSGTDMHNIEDDYHHNSYDRLSEITIVC